MDFFGRASELKRLRDLWVLPQSDLIFIRGRRRVGKSELIRQITREYAVPGGRAFQFSGRMDESDAFCRARLAKSWELFVGSANLSRLRREALTWDLIFEEFEKEALKSHSTGLPLLIAFDEIQWLAKKHSGILGALKEFWERVHKKLKIKIVLSGSSHRFFASEVDHAEGVLRGLRTTGDLWVYPFTLEEVQTFYFPKWNKESVAFLYLMFGGVPYYLDRFEAEKPFLRSLNDAAFTEQSIFIDEIDAILKVESTGEGALANVKRVLRSLGHEGKNAAAIEKSTGIAGPHIHQILNRLESYGIILERNPFGEKKKNKSGVRYFMNDFFLNTYFQILEPLGAKIRDNSRQGMLINDIISSKNGYYISGFSGQAFERLINHILLSGSSNSSHRIAAIFKKLQLGESTFEVGTFWVPHQTQIDIVVSCEEDRQVRILEAKWKGSALGLSEGEIFMEELANKYFPLPGNNWTKKNFMVLANGATEECRIRAEQLDIGIIELTDLFV